MNVRLVGLPEYNGFYPPKKLRWLGIEMPALKPEISIGNLLSMAVSCIAIFSVVVTLAVFGTNMRADIDNSKKDIVDIKAALAKQATINDSNLTFQSEVRVDLKYVRNALDRMEDRKGFSAK
ncbi:hypothetical protein [Hyphomicrobium sp. ghe19]|uniref:hypothetical protein n=1 Tax=Hyphomicrobium sp. ghe19 TaxID=2682968 RepID=UPI001366EB32|nr:hypothetical protein HYPP_02480 [Hyphomicrobium sp. ghe19]